MSEMLLPLARRLPLSDESNRFVEWINREGINRKARGAAIGPRSLLSFLVAWYKLNDGSATTYFNQQFPGSSRQALHFAIDFLEQNQASPSPVSAYPFVTEEAEEALLDAQELVTKLKRDEIEPYHIYAALLLRASKDQDPDAFLGFTSGRVQELRKSFLQHVTEGGYGEAWEYWKRAFRTEGDEGASSFQKGDPLGRLFRPRRGAKDEELALQIEKYAAAIADAFVAAKVAAKQDADEAREAARVAEGAAAGKAPTPDDVQIAAKVGRSTASTVGSLGGSDFVFSLYAPWGRGKSKLIHKVASLLEWRDRYATVFFSAWKYPSRPEIWVHLYQKIADEAKKGRLSQRLRIAFRIGLLKHGWLPLLLGFGLLAATRFQLNIARWFLDGLGILGLLIIGSFVWNATKLGKQIAHSHFTIPDHAEKLGLQAVIGQDFKHLLNIWINPRGSTENPGRIKALWKRWLAPDDSDINARVDFSRWSTRISLFLVWLFIWVTLATVAWKVHTHLPIHEGEPFPDAKSTQHATFTGKFASERIEGELEIDWGRTNILIQTSATENPPPDPLNRWDKCVAVLKHFQAPIVYALLALTGVAASVMLWVLVRPPKRYEQLLLVVDDLDRCEPDQMLAVIDSLRLFLDEKEISERLQVAMLLDRKILKRAIVERGDKQKIVPDGGEERFFREQEEKLFAAGFQLLALDSDQVKELAEALFMKTIWLQLKEQLDAVEDRIKALEAELARKPDNPTETEKDLAKAQTERANLKSRLNAVGYVETGVTQSKPQPSSKQSEPSGTSSPTDGISAAQLRAENRRLARIVFNDEEGRELLKALGACPPAETTPRSIRAFIIRYQLIRLILTRLDKNKEPDPKIIVPKLAARLYPRQGVRAEQPNSQDIVDSVIAAVAGMDEGDPVVKSKSQSQHQNETRS